MTKPDLRKLMEQLRRMPNATPAERSRNSGACVPRKLQRRANTRGNDNPQSSPAHTTLYRTLYSTSSVTRRASSSPGRVI